MSPAEADTAVAVGVLAAACAGLVLFAVVAAVWHELRKRRAELEGWRSMAVYLGHDNLKLRAELAAARWEVSR